MLITLLFAALTMAGAAPSAGPRAVPPTATQPPAISTVQPTTRPAFVVSPATGVRRPTVGVYLAEGFHAGTPMLIAVDDIKSVMPWVTQKTETVRNPATKRTRQVVTAYVYGSRIETSGGAYYVSDRFEDLARRLMEQGWGNVLPSAPWVAPGDPATRPSRAAPE